jgi:MFS family permease
LFSLAAAAFVDRGEDQALSILWAHIQLSLGAAIGSLGPLLGASRLVSTLTLPFWGYAADRWSRRSLLIWFTGFWGLWTLLISVVESVPQLLGVRLISAVGAGVFVPAAFSLIGDLYGYTQRGRAAGIVLSVATLGGLTVAGVLPLLAAHSAESWRWGFVALGGVSCLTGVIMLFGLREPTRGSSDTALYSHRRPRRSAQITWADLQVLRTNASWRILVVIEALRAVGAALLLGWLFTWITSLGVESAMFAIAAVFLLGIGVGQLISGWLSDYFAQRFPRYGQLTLGLIGILLVVPITMVFISSDGQSLTRLLLCAALSGLSGSVGIVVWPIGQAIVAPELRGSSRGITEMLGGIASAVALAASGPVVDWLGVTNALLVLAPLPVLLSSVLWLRLYITFPRDRLAVTQP